MDVREMKDVAAGKADEDFFFCRREEEPRLVHDQLIRLF